MLLGVYNYTVILTYFGMLVSFTGITMALQGNIHSALVCGSGSGFYCSGLYLLCALIRLAWFNVDEEERQEVSDGAREVYYGLPVTMAALILPALVGLCRLCRWPLGILGPLTLLVMGGAFLTPFRLKKPALPAKIGMLLCGGAELMILLAGVDL